MGDAGGSDGVLVGVDVGAGARVGATDALGEVDAEVAAAPQAVRIMTETSGAAKEGRWMSLMPSLWAIKCGDPLHDEAAPAFLEFGRLGSPMGHHTGRPCGVTAAEPALDPWGGSRREDAAQIGELRCDLTRNAGETRQSPRSSSL